VVSYERQRNCRLILEKLRGPSKKNLHFFEIAGEDGRYVPAKARITGKNTVGVESPKVLSPTDVRYMFRQDMPEVSLVNSAGIPASPFMADGRKPERSED